MRYTAVLTVRVRVPIPGDYQPVSTGHRASEHSPEPSRRAESELTEKLAKKLGRGVDVLEISVEVVEPIEETT